MKQPMLGNRISTLRKERGFTQEELAEYSSLSLRTIQRIESGLVNPRSYTLKAIGKILNYNFFHPTGREGSEDLSLSNWNKFIKSVIRHSDLRINPVKKISVIILFVCLVIAFFFSFKISEKVQKFDRSRFARSPDRGIMFFFPKGSHIAISNVKDTADYFIDEHLIQEYKSYIFLNGDLIGNAFRDDTVIYEKGNIEIRSSYTQFPSLKNNGITYVIPSRIKINDRDIIVDTEWMHFDRHYLSEHHNEIYLDQQFQGEVDSGDFVVYYYDEILLLD